MPDTNITELIQQGAGTYGKSPIQVMTCTVKSVDKAERTATVVPVTDNLAPVPAQLMSDIADGLLIIPDIGSTVRVLLSEQTTPTVIQYSEVSEVYIVTGGQYVRIYGSGLELDGTSYGGVMKVVPSVSAWNATQKDINTLKTQLASLTSAITGVGGTPLTGASLGGLFTTALASYNASALQITTRSQIENDKVKHGNGS